MCHQCAQTHILIHLPTPPRSTHTRATRLLRPGGLALVVTGNAEEPPRVPGPPALTQEEVLAPFLGSTESPPRFTLGSLTQGRFDLTPAYGPTPPLCWVARFERA